MIGTPMPCQLPTHLVAAAIAGREVVTEIPCYESYLLPPTQFYATEDTHKPAGIRLAKMLSQYDESPSSQLWADIQRLAREILK